MCIAIEPMINMGVRNVVIEKDGWTVRTADKKPSAHFEHTIAIRNEGPEILTTFEFIEKVLGTATIELFFNIWLIRQQLHKME